MRAISSEVCARKRIVSAPGNVFYSLAGNPSDPDLPPPSSLPRLPWECRVLICSPGIRLPKRETGPGMRSGYVHHHDQEKHVWVWVSSLAFHTTMEGCFLLGLESSIHILI